MRKTSNNLTPAQQDKRTEVLDSLKHLEVETRNKFPWISKMVHETKYFIAKVCIDMQSSGIYVGHLEILSKVFEYILKLHEDLSNATDATYSYNDFKAIFLGCCRRRVIDLIRVHERMYGSTISLEGCYLSGLVINNNVMNPEDQFWAREMFKQAVKDGQAKKDDLPDEYFEYPVKNIIDK